MTSPLHIVADGAEGRRKFGAAISHAGQTAAGTQHPRDVAQNVAKIRGQTLLSQWSDPDAMLCFQ